METEAPGETGNDHSLELLESSPYLVILFL